MIYPSFSGGGLSGFDSVGFGFCSVGFGAVVLVGVGSAGFVVGVGSAGFGVGDGSSVAGTGVDVIVTVGVILGSVPLVGSGVVVSGAPVGLPVVVGVTDVWDGSVVDSGAAVGEGDGDGVGVSVGLNSLEPPALSG